MMIVVMNVMVIVSCIILTVGHTVCRSAHLRTSGRKRQDNVRDVEIIVSDVLTNWNVLNA